MAGWQNPHQSNGYSPHTQIHTHGTCVPLSGWMEIEEVYRRLTESLIANSNWICVCCGLRFPENPIALHQFGWHNDERWRQHTRNKWVETTLGCSSYKLFAWLLFFVSPGKQFTSSCKWTADCLFFRTMTILHPFRCQAKTTPIYK